jgi:ABC-type hemin transport system substrate-binding protein
MAFLFSSHSSINNTIMKLAEALILRADTQKRIEQLKQRLNANARVQQGEKPAEDPKKLMTELDVNWMPKFKR